MSTMQIVFSIIGLVLIAAIIGHGVWTIRQNEKTQRQRAELIAQKRRQLDEKGFDDDGIGAVRVVKKAPVAKAEEVAEPRLESVNDDPVANETEAEPVAPTPSTPASAGTTASAIRATQDEPDLDLPEVKVEPKAQPAATAPQPTQQSMDLPLVPNDNEPVLNEEPDEVIVLHVTGNIEGPVLLQQMTELGFKFGDFDIFHRHVDTAGNGPVLFSLANMFNPGSFNIDTIETFQTEGVALFLALPIKSNSLQAFTMMHNAAVKLAAAVGRGQVLDEHRNPLTRQAVQHIHQRIREFERKRLLKPAN